MRHLFFLAVIVASMTHSSMAHACERVAVEGDEIRLLRFPLTLASANECKDVEACSEKYQLVDQFPSPGHSLPRVTSVRLDPVDANNLVLTLERALVEPTQKLTLLIAALYEVAESPKPPHFAKCPLASVLIPLSDFQDIDYVVASEAFAPDPAPAPADITLSVVHAKSETPIHVVVQSINPRRMFASGKAQTFRIHLQDRLPAIGKVKISVSGFEEVDGKPLKLSANMDTSERPATKDKSTYYFAGDYLFKNGPEEKDSYGIDLKLNPPLFRRFTAATSYELSGLLEGQTGSDDRKLSDRFRVAIQGTRWFPSFDQFEPGDTRYALTLAPFYESDTHRDNQDYGAALTASILWPTYNRSLLTRREEARSADPKEPEPGLGYSFLPDVGLEGGVHRASSSLEVEGESFVRVVAALEGSLEFRHFITLSVSISARYLFDNEVHLVEDDVVMLDEGLELYYQVEFARSFGSTILSVKYQNGRLPPQWKQVDVTTVGIGFRLQ